MAEKIFVYIRVSTGKQADALTYENQERAISRFLEDKDVVVVEVFRDIGASGASRGRPAFNAMLSRLDEVQGICVYDDDRLARDFDLSIEFMLVLKRAGKKLYIARKSKVVDFGMRDEQLIHIIQGWVAEQEREKIRSRQLEGIRRYREKHGGRWGRPRKRVDWKRYEEYKLLGLSDNAVSKLLGMDYRTLKRYKDARAGPGAAG